MLSSRLRLIAFVAVIAPPLIFPILHAQAKEECTRKYSACIEESKKLPGSVYDKDSAFFKAWGVCQHEGNICEFGPASSSSSSIISRSVQEAAAAGLVATVKSFDGDVEVQKDNGDFVELKPGQQVALKPGDFVSTGFDSSVTLTFNDGRDELEVYHTTQLRIDETLLKKNRQRTQMYLRVGSIRVMEKHTAAIRGDFVVTWPSNITSVRDSAMVVRYDDKQKIGTVYVTEDKAYVKAKTKGAKEIVVPEGYMVTTGPDGTVSTPKKFSAEDLAAAQGKGGQKEKVIQTPGKPSKTSLPGAATAPAPVSASPSRLPVVKTWASAEADGYPAKNATDDSKTSMWVASTQVLTANNDVWIILDFGAPKRVQKLKWLASAWEKPYPSNGPSKYRIERSDDGQAWTAVGAVVDLGVDGKDPRQITGGETFDVTTRYLRLKVERVNDGTGWSLGLKDFWAEGTGGAKSTPDKQSCAKQYEACIDASRKLPGPLLKKGSPMNNAWAECSRQGQLCNQR